MIADDRETPVEVALKMMTAPVWVPIYLAYQLGEQSPASRAD